MNAIDIVDRIIADAVDRQASDVHFEPMDAGMRVRARTDGDLHVLMDISPQQVPQIINRLKIMASLDIAITRSPQDGTAHYRLRDATLDLRFSTVPTVLGEKVEVRILDPRKGLHSLEALQLPPDVSTDLLSMLRKPYGLFLVVGPTGSGKTTTLYALLQHLNTVERNIITIEDPVEYHIPGINQIQVSPRAGMTFANGLRAMLRQDPDIILVGELRDTETAEIACRAALTGHLVLATLHTRDATEAIIRLKDMGLTPATIASCLRGVLAQRLVPVHCPACRGQGGVCCGGTGFSGRRALFEFLPVTAKIQGTIHKNVGYNELRAVADLGGGLGRSFLKSAEEFLSEGCTSPDKLIEFLERPYGIKVQEVSTHRRPCRRAEPVLFGEASASGEGQFLETP